MHTENIVDGAYVASDGKTFSGINPASNEPLTPEFNTALPAFVDNAMEAAVAAFKIYKKVSNADKAGFLRNIATELEAAADDLFAMAAAESGLTEIRLRGELGRTTAQLRMFASLVEEGAWVDAIIVTADPDRKPMPRADLRRMLVPIGPVVVFGASNFPLAFSVAGGDTAAALAAGCPVVVKAHPAHPGTSAITGEAILRAIKLSNMPAGVFSMLYDGGHEIGTALVQHPATKAVAFTGSLKGGMALHKLAQERAEPIPVFAEMGSLNPVFLLPEALKNNAQGIADKYAGSVTNGAGQFCTKPGLMFGIKDEGIDTFKTAIASAIRQTVPVTMLTPGIFDNYRMLSADALMESGVEVVATSADHPGTNHHRADAIIATVTAKDFISNPKLSEEVFGPYALLVEAADPAELEAAAATLQGQLTTTIMAEGDDANNFYGLITALQEKAGRIIFNGVPTGVEVCSAMHHGGPFPATNNQYTSVGSTSIRRFVRPMVWQDWPDALLPDELKEANPLGIRRMVDDVLRLPGEGHSANL